MMPPRNIARKMFRKPPHKAVMTVFSHSFPSICSLCAFTIFFSSSNCASGESSTSAISTSSLTGMLGQIYFALSRAREPDTGIVGREFDGEVRRFSFFPYIPSFSFRSRSSLSLLRASSVE